MSLSRKKTSRTLYVSQRYKKLRSADSVHGELGKGKQRKDVSSFPRFIGFSALMKLFTAQIHLNHDLL